MPLAPGRPVSLPMYILPDRDPFVNKPARHKTKTKGKVDQALQASKGSPPGGQRGDKGRKERYSRRIVSIPLSLSSPLFLYLLLMNPPRSAILLLFTSSFLHKQGRSSSLKLRQFLFRLQDPVIPHTQGSNTHPLLGTEFQCELSTTSQCAQNCCPLDRDALLCTLSSVA